MNITNGRHITIVVPMEDVEVLAANVSVTIIFHHDDGDQIVAGNGRVVIGNVSASEQAKIDDKVLKIAKVKNNAR